VLELLTATAILGQLLALLRLWVRRRVPVLPRGLEGGDAPPVVLVKPVLSANGATLGRCRSWLDSAAAYPGECLVVFSTLDALEKPLRRLLGDAPGVEVRLVSTCNADRRREKGLDKTERMIAAEPLARGFLRGREGLLLFSDEDVEAVDLRSIERIAAAAARPGCAATVAFAAAPRKPGSEWWREVFLANMQFNNAVYMIGATFFSRLHGALLGWTMAFWASDLRALGGFAAARAGLSEDVALGARAPRQGLRVRMFRADGAVCMWETWPSARAFWQQQVRWRAQLRGCHPVLTAGILAAFPLALPFTTSAALLLWHPAPESGLLMVLACSIQAASLRVSLRRLWVLPLHEMLALAAQLRGTLAGEVTWGDWRYRISPRARIVAKHWIGDRIDPTSPRPDRIRPGVSEPVTG